MTMIISAHLGDCILIASDKRSMHCDLETGNMRLATDEEQKIKLWCRGAIAGSGETVFLNPTVDVKIAIQATLTLIIAGTLAGFFPAKKAVSISPIEALRAE